MSFIRWNIRENIYRNESYLEILAITNKKQIYFYAAKIIYIIIHVISLCQWIQHFTIVSELKDVVNFFRVLAVHFRVTDGSKHDVQKNRNGGHTQNHQPAHDQQEWHKYKLKVDNKEQLFKFSNFEGSHAILINTLPTLYACSIPVCKTISFFFYSRQLVYNDFKFYKVDRFSLLINSYQLIQSSIQVIIVYLL